MGDDIKLDWHYEAHKSLQRRYENVIERAAELNREIGRLTALNNDLRAKLRELVGAWSVIEWWLSRLGHGEGALQLAVCISDIEALLEVE